MNNHKNASLNIFSILIVLTFLIAGTLTTTAQSLTDENRPAGRNVWTTTQVSGASGYPVMVATVPTNPNIGFVAWLNPSFSQTFRSTDGGLSYGYAGGGLGVSDYNNLVVAPSDSNYIYSGGGANLWRSVNGGTAWVQTGLANRFEGAAFSRHAVAIHPTNPGIVLAATTHGTTGATRLWRCTDGSINWTATNLTASAVRSIAFAKSDPTIVYAGTNNGLYKSIDTGVTWTLTGSFGAKQILGLVVDPTNPNIVYAGGTYIDGQSSGSIWKSTDGGANWTNLNTSWTNLNVTAIVIDPTKPLTVYAGGTIGGIWKSSDGGAIWTAFNNGIAPDSIISSIVIDNTGRRLYAGTIGFALAYTYDDRKPFDFDGDGKTDISIFRPSNGQWWINRSSTLQTVATQFGASTDKPMPADFTGDGKADIAFFRPSTGEWFIVRSEDNSFLSFTFGANNDMPLVGDFDGDGKADPGVYRPSTREWFILKSSGGTIITTFGTAGDVPVTADYDGDGKSDIAIYRPSAGQWWIQRSSNSSVYAFQFGTSSDKTVQGDYSGDGKADSAFWRPSTGEWFILRSEDSSFYSVPFGTNGDLPVPGDYDGDGKFDTAVFRPSANDWYVNRSTAGLLITGFGVTGDRPLPNVFIP